MNFRDYPDVGNATLAAQVCDCDVRLVRKAIEDGELQAVRLGRRVLVTKWALADFLKIPMDTEIDPPETSPEGSPVHPGPGLRVVEGGP